MVLLQTVTLNNIIVNITDVTVFVILYTVKSKNIAKNKSNNINVFSL